MARTANKKIFKPAQSQPAWESIAEKIADKTPDKIQHSQFVGGHMVDHKTELRIRTQQIAIGIPMDEVIFSQFFTNFQGIGMMPWDTVITTQSTYLPMARNQIHDKYLESGGGTHLLMLDSDVLPPPGVINSLMAHNKPIVGGWYVKKEKFWVKDAQGNPLAIQRPVVYDNNEKGEFIHRMSPGNGLEKVGGAGAGIWLMSREVAEKLGKSPYDMEGGGEDLVLCNKIKALGYDLWIDWSLKCAHMGVFFV